jgi:hypothetical protein
MTELWRVIYTGSTKHRHPCQGAATAGPSFRIGLPQIADPQREPGIPINLLGLDKEVKDVQLFLPGIPRLATTWQALRVPAFGQTVAFKLEGPNWNFGLGTYHGRRSRALKPVDPQQPR